MSPRRPWGVLAPLKDVRQESVRSRPAYSRVPTADGEGPVVLSGLSESTPRTTGRLCEVCADPVPDDIVPAETIAGGLQLECMSCWMERMEERMTLHPKPADL